MKHFYETPTVSVDEFHVEDAVRTSGVDAVLVDGFDLSNVWEEE